MRVLRKSLFQNAFLNLPRCISGDGDAADIKHLDKFAQEILLHLPAFARNVPYRLDLSRFNSGPITLMLRGGVHQRNSVEKAVAS